MIKMCIVDKKCKEEFEFIKELTIDGDKYDLYSCDCGEQLLRLKDYYFEL